MNFYLNKYGYLPPQISSSPTKNVGIIIVIPCFNEPDLISSLNSIENCANPEVGVEVIVVLNSGEHHPQSIKDQNENTKAEFENWKGSLESNIDYFLIEQNELPKKHAGVGLARKIGMDEAVSRFHELDRDGIIVCFDADSNCQENYLEQIEEHFKNNPKSPGCSVYFEHPIEGNEYDDEIYKAIINYELHLRYYKQCQEYIGLPYAFHTVGSSMAVKSSAYQKQGGMNKRKAGEDFYFIHKIIALGNFTEINSTRVIPSPRVSNRVPFGTGKAVADWIENKTDQYSTYNFKIFQHIKRELLNLRDIYEGNYKPDLPGLSDEKLEEIIRNTSDFASFKKRFFNWFDAFRLLKMVHHYRDNGFPNQPLLQSTMQLDKAMNRQENLNPVKEQLLRYRQFDCNSQSSL